MRYLALATDYDGTLAHDGLVDDTTIEALERVRKSGRKLILVTGRELDDLRLTFAHIDKFDAIVAENGALLYDPAADRERPLIDGSPPEFVERLRQRGVTPLATGRGIVATREPWEQVTLQVIRELGLELQVIFNKGAVMVLPTGVNKATGLRCALDQLGLSRHNVAGVGDAENDHAFLAACECSAAVANALAAVKDHADIVTAGARGDGVRELIGMMLSDDLASVAPKLSRHDIRIGTGDDGRQVCIPVHDSTLLIAGSSGGGKSTLTTGIMERISAADYQFCAVDPEGDYQSFPKAVILGDSKTPPALDEVLSVLDKPDQSAIVNMMGVRFDDRPLFFERLLDVLARLRERTGRPHWTIVDEAHHVLPVSERKLSMSLGNSLLVTLEPDRIHRDVLERVTHLIAVGDQPAATIDAFCSRCGFERPATPSEPLERGEAMLLGCGAKEVPLRFRVAPAETPQVRHSRKYASAELTPDRSFYFRGPEGKLNLRAQNLVTFLQLLEGVDDETWKYHLRRREYSAWFRENIKNDELADEAARIEEQDLSAADSKVAVRSAIEERYTLPA